VRHPERGGAFLRSRKLPEGTLAESDTLTLAPDTSPVETEAPVLEEVEDTAEETTNDEDTGESTEDTPEAELLTPEKVKEIADEARKAALAEVQEQQTVKALQQRVAQSYDWYARRGTAEIKGIVEHFAKEVDSGKTVEQALAAFNEDYIRNGAGARMASAVMTDQLALADQVNDQWISQEYKDWRIPSELVRRRELARGSGNTAEAIRVNNEIIRRAERENIVPSEAKKLAEVERAKSKSAAQVAAAKAGDSRRANAEMPTTVTGGSGRSGTITSMGDADRAYNKGEITGAQYSKYAQQYGVSLG
jgi:hypothetical protein